MAEQNDREPPAPAPKPQYEFSWRPPSHSVEPHFVRTNMVYDTGPVADTPTVVQAPPEDNK